MPHSITAKQLAPGAVTHVALGSKAVKGNNIGSRRPVASTAQECPNGTVTYGAPCSVGSYTGLLGGMSSTVVLIPAGGGDQTFFAAPSGAGDVATLTPQATITPNETMAFSKLIPGRDVILGSVSQWLSAR